MAHSSQDVKGSVAGKRGFALNWIDLSMLAVVVIWGLNYAVVKQAIQELLPMVFTSLRFLLASVFVFWVLKASGEDLRFDRRDLGKLLLLGAIGITGCQVGFVQGIARTTASNSSLLLATSPIFVTLLSGLLNLEPVTPLVGLGVVLSFSGTALIIGLGTGGLSFSSQALTGNLISLGGAVCWAFYTILANPMLRRYSPLKLTWLSMMFGTLFLFLLSTGDLARQQWASVSWRGWLGLGYAVVLAGAVGFAIWNVSIHRAGNTRTAVFSNLIPIVAVTASWLFLGDKLGVWQIAGALITLTGVTITRLAPRKPAMQTGGG